jgi:transcriptional regulator with XRE-family HTH domain
VDKNMSIAYNSVHMKNDYKKISENFGLKIMVERKKQKLSQEDLAELANMHRNSIGDIERAEKSPTLESMCAIANALNLDLQDLLNNSF